MDVKTIYHGSRVIVKKPDINKSRTDTDFGRGFYCTEDVELAKEWASDELTPGYVNQYEIDISPLKILHLNCDKYSPLHWLALLVNNRTVRISTPLQRSAIEWLKENYLIDISDFDVIIGYRADDSYFSIVRAFIMNSISLDQLSRSLRLGGWGDQFVLKSKKAYAAIRYIDSTEVDQKIYYPKRKQRNETASSTFFQMVEESDENSIFIRDLIMMKK